MDEVGASGGGGGGVEASIGVGLGIRGGDTPEKKSGGFESKCGADEKSPGMKFSFSFAK